MTNFDFLTQQKQFETFSGAAVAAEQVFGVDIASCVVMCRRALELGVKWLYSVDSSLSLPYQDTLATLIHTDEFKNLVKEDLFNRINYIRKVGNNAAHNTRNITKGQAIFALENLFYFMDFIACCYGDNYQKHLFNRTLLEQPAPALLPPLAAEIPLSVLVDTNKAVKPALTAKRQTQAPAYKPVPIDPTEAETRKAYIDVMLTEGGWERGKNWQDEVYIENMPNASGEGFADYVLYGDDGRPLAVIEAKKTSVDPAKGRQQAKLYADDLERRYGRRPIIFLTNGYDTRIWVDQEGGYPERRVSGIYSKRDLEKEFNKLAQREPLTHLLIDENISGRYYQKEAIKAVCETFGQKNKRKALLVMATGSGKTRTVISLVKILIEKGWVRNFLFLADRNSLVIQAKRAFVNLLPNVSVTNLCEGTADVLSRGVFSTYQTMMNCIDASKDEDGNKVFTCGHFDLIIVDEAHRSIYKKYQDIFTYFDSLLVGLTATPKNDIDRNTYEAFELEDGVPTYGYELAQAVTDKFLVDYKTFESTLKFLDEGIVYDDLSEDEKREYEEKFLDEEGNVPDAIGGSALNEWVFNKDTIRKVIDDLMTKGLKIEYGTKLGKTIIFAKNHLHAEKIVEIFNQEYPQYAQRGFCRVIDNYTNYAQSVIDEFSDAKKYPQIAVSVDMLDTGIDVPEVLNLVFFKKVMSKAKFWQMIGRGTRLCPGLLNGDDKKEFYIFDYGANFKFFKTPRKDTGASTLSLQEQLFRLKVELIYKLQELPFQEEFFINLRKQLVKNLHHSVTRLNRENFSVRQHLRIVDKFFNMDAFTQLDYEDVFNLTGELAPLVLPEEGDADALRFDALCYGIELAKLREHSCKRALKDLKKRVEGLISCGTILAVAAKKDLVESILHTDDLDRMPVPDIEEIRLKLRDLMKFVEVSSKTRYETNFADCVTGYEENNADLKTGELENYRKKAEFFLRQHQDIPAISKLKTNEPLTEQNVQQLEHILWKELGSRDNYTQEVGDIPLGAFVRSVVGLDQSAAKAAFSKFIDDQNLNSSQIYFVNQIINYIVQNGMLTDMSILQHPPFTDRGSVAEVFPSPHIWDGIYSAIQSINANAYWG